MLYSPRSTVFYVAMYLEYFQTQNIAPVPCAGHKPDTRERSNERLSWQFA
jgi:hypothetical protein